VSTVFDALRARLQRSPKTWLVTGVAGFVGSHVLETLLRDGQHVVGLDNFATGKRDNLELVRQAVGDAAFARLRFLEADIRDRDACQRACTGVDHIVHLAALGSVPRSIEHPLDTHLSNVDGTLHIFLAALDAGVPRLAYASSSSVYGDEPELPKLEDRIGSPLSPYAASKRINEIYAQVLGRTHGLVAVGLRYFNVIGPRQDPAGPYAAVIPRWVDTLGRGETPIIFGDGETSRDFCPVANVVQATLLAATTEADLGGRAYNVALGQRTTLNELYTLLRDGLAQRGVDCAGREAIHEDFRAGDVRHSLADISAAQRDLGYAPSTTLSEGIDLILDDAVRN
jgi:UDP-N-acetylglucosamine 4-epimerase